jgi:hypothetical protein
LSPAGEREYVSPLGESRMSAWTQSPTEAARNIAPALGVINGILSFAKDGKGKPADKERALFAAAIVFTYGVWESFVEQLAIELAMHVSREISEHKVPKPVRTALEKKTAWELAVSPGWRVLWHELVKVEALGDSADKHGMNTAREGQVTRLLTLAGPDKPLHSVPQAKIPSHLSQPERTVGGALDGLVSLRGEIVHTGKVPDELRKSHVLAWRNFVESAAEAVDEACRQQCRDLLAR